MRKEFLLNYSVEVESQILVDTPFGRQQFDARELQYLGNSEKFRRDVLSLRRNGQPEDSGRPRGRFGRWADLTPQLQGRDLLTASEFFRDAEIVGPSAGSLAGMVEIKTRPKIKGLQVKEARLWVEQDSAMPVRVQLRFSMGVFIRDARLTLNLEWDEDHQFTLPRSQTVNLSGGGFGGGARGDFSGIQVEVSTR